MLEIKQIGKYKIEGVIGEGGMGTVFKASDTLIKRFVAIKIMSDPNFKESAKKRFFREAQAIGQLQHSNIITIYDAGEYEKMPYLVVEYLEGNDLNSLLKSNKLPPVKQLITNLIEICEALEYSHKHNIIHRDIKPGNIFIQNNGEAKLMDFGIAKIDDVALTQTGTLLGTIYYMSPEQISGKDVDFRADIFSLGVLIYELFARKKPFQGKTITAVMSNILFSEPVPFVAQDKNLPPAIAQIIAKAMAKDKKDRYQTASDLGLDLSKLKTMMALGSKKKISPPPAKKEVPSEIKKSASIKMKQEKPATKKIEPKKSSTKKIEPKKSVAASDIDLLTEEKTSQFVSVKKRNYSWLYALLSMILIFVIIAILFQKKIIVLKPRQNFQTTQKMVLTPIPSNEETRLPKILSDNKNLTENQTSTSSKNELLKVKPSPLVKAGQPTIKSLNKKTQFNTIIHQARVYKAQKNWNKLEITSAKALGLIPGNEEAISLQRLAQKKIKAASSENRQINSLMDKGRIAFNSHDYKSAIKFMNEVLVIKKNYFLAEELLKRAREKLIIKQKNENQKLYKQGLKAYQEKKWQKSIDIMKQILAVNPNNIQAQKIKNEAIQYRDSSSTQTSSNLTFLKLKGQQAFDKAQYKKCISIMNQILKKAPSDTFAINLKSKANKKSSGLASIVIRDYIKSMKKAFRTEDFKKCSLYINKILAHQPKNITALKYQKKVLNKQNAAMKNAEKIKIKNEIEHHVSQGNLSQALKLSETLLEKFPDDIQLRNLRDEIKVAYMQSQLPTPTPLPKIKIKHIPPEKLLYKEKFPVIMTFFGYEKSVKIYLFFRNTQSNNWKKTKMKAKGVYYKASISGRNVKVPAIEYFFVITDKNGETIYSSKNSPYRVEVFKDSTGSIPVF